MIQAELLIKLRKHKDADVRELISEYEKLTESPYYTGYVALLIQIETWNEEIKSTPVKISDRTEEDQRAFEKSHKYFTTIDLLYNKLEYIRGKMTPESLVMAKAEATSTIDEVRNKVKDEME